MFEGYEVVVLLTAAIVCLHIECSVMDFEFEGIYGVLLLLLFDYVVIHFFQFFLLSGRWDVCIFVCACLVIDTNNT